MTLLFDLIYVSALALGWPYLLWRRRTRGPKEVRLGEYLGRVPPRKVASRCVWLHGVSLGEINATRTLVAELRRRAPSVVIVVSSTTGTGLERARALYPDLQVFCFPLDLSFSIRTLLNRIRPSVIVLMELEVWPNLIAIATADGVPVVIANGRITEERSMRRFRKPVIRSLARRMFSRIRWVGAQDQTYASRFLEVGVPAGNVEVVGSVKYDAADVADAIPGQETLAIDMGIDTSRPLWVCGSTGPGEEERILDAFRSLLPEFPGLQLAIIPRKPERFDEVAARIVQSGFACLRRSSGQPTVPPTANEPVPVFLGDTMGELRKFYGLANVVFVGRTLVPLGGSDVMEVAGLAKPTIVGPHTENFREAVELLMAADGCRRIAGHAELAPAVGELLRNGDRAANMGEAARQTILRQRGATERTVERILQLIELA